MVDRHAVEANLKARNLWGILLIIIGCVSLSYAGITYTRRQTVLHVGSLVATDDKKETIPIPPLVGAAALIAGIVLVAMRPEQ